MRNKVVLITGASSGLGCALAMDLARRGANLVLSARRKDRLHSLREELLKRYPDIDVLAVSADMAHKRSSQLMVEEGLARFSRIDHFIANAGLGMWSRFRDLRDPDELLELMNLNYMGVVYGLFYALPHLRSSRGSFVAISSIQGVIPVAFHTGYVASKYAVNGLIETIRLEEPDVHFLLALPSWISGTELRSHAVTGSKEGAINVKKSHGKGATSSIRCAQEIIEAIIRRDDEIFIPKRYRFAPLLRNLMKRTFDRVVMGKIKGQIE